jgi:hypothetical protein
MPLALKRDAGSLLWMPVTATGPLHFVLMSGAFALKLAGVNVEQPVAVNTSAMAATRVTPFTIRFSHRVLESAAGNANNSSLRDFANHTEVPQHKDPILRTPPHDEKS